MKRLYLLRHAKSSWGNPELADFERPLNDRGRQAARLIGRLLATRGLKPEAIISSPARRAADTARLILDASRLDVEITYDPSIYEASPQTLICICAAVDDSFASAMVVGHNPGIEGFIKILTGRDEAMPTAALAIIDLSVSRWGDLAAECGTLVEIIKPRDHQSA